MDKPTLDLKYCAIELEEKFTGKDEFEFMNMLKPKQAQSYLEQLSEAFPQYIFYSSEAHNGTVIFAQKIIEVIDE